MDKDQILTLLKRHICWVTFTKVDNTLRSLRCTLIPEQLPEKKEGGNSRVKNEDVIPVFDLDAKAWKSFRVSSLNGISTCDPKESGESSAEHIDVEGVVNKCP